MLGRIGAVALAVFGLLAVSVPAGAQQYPTRIVTIIVPYPAGGPTDETTRIVANFLSKRLGQNFIVENVTGGSTIIAMNRLVNAAPDGYTLLMHNLQIAANVTLIKNPPFDTEKAVTAVMLVNKNPLLLVGRPGLPANNLKELIALMKTQRLREGLPGFGTTGHLTSALFAQEAKVQIDFIPYRGAAPAMNDLLGDHVDLFVGTPQSVVPHIAAGKLKAYGITAKERSPQLPNVESMVEALGPKFDIVYWQGLFAPAGTPETVINTLNAALQEAVSDPAIVETWTKEGFSAFPKEQRSVAAANAMMKSEITRWGQVIRDNNIQLSQ
ncbi:MAG TPA: tripartite tricarboxylate transporter substrate binding protein [Pseudolabrys sp.]|nr:tripartite tricarboxylate transporter substrate binding protein [Pseudolabrys sp.]